MFNKEFYPTPSSVIDMMIAGIEIEGRVILEPSAGSGNIVDHVKSLGAKEVIACELHKELRMIVERKCNVIGSDFFEVSKEQISHIDVILMNPPFSNADRHIQHAWDIAPDGCTIVALCNAQTLENKYTFRRSILGEAIEKYGHWRNIGDAFSTADRKTDVEIGLIHIFKPKSGESEFDGYFFDMNEEQEEQVDGSGIMKHNDVREIVNRYIEGVKMFDSVVDASAKINSMISPISNGLGISFGAHQTYTSRGVQHGTITRDTFKKELQKSAWRSVFDKMDMQKYVTSSVMSDINKFVEQQQATPFTMNNVYKMIEIIFGTHGSRMDRVLVETFDRICNLSADNSEAGEKWKTNSNYKINRRFIDTYICDHDNRWPTQTVKVRCSDRNNLIDDIVKALCHITGKKYDDVMRLEYVHNGYNYYFAPNLRILSEV